MALQRGALRPIWSRPDTLQKAEPMTALTLVSSRSPAGVFIPVKRSFNAVRAAFAASRDLRLLNALTDRQLADIGLSREEVPQLLFRRHFA